MKRLFGVFVITILIAFIGSDVYAVSEATGLYLMIEPGARPAGMGNAFTGLADDGTAVFYNPSGLAFQRGHEISLMHVNWLPQFGTDMFYEFGSYKHHLEGLGTFAIDIVFLNLGEQAGRDEEGNDTGSFSSWEGAISGSFGTQLSENWAVGLQLRYIRSSLAPRGAGAEKGVGVGNAFAVGISTLYKMPFLPSLSIGANLANMGPKMAYIDAAQADPIPTNLRLGLAYKVVNSKYNKLTVTADAMKLLVTRYKDKPPEDTSDPFYVAIIKAWYKDGVAREFEKIERGAGIEYTYSDLISLRAGYYFDKEGKRKFATFGAGIGYHTYHFDFGYVSAEEGHPLSNTMRFSLSIGF